MNSCMHRLPQVVGVIVFEIRTILHRMTRGGAVVTVGDWNRGCRENTGSFHKWCLLHSVTSLWPVMGSVALITERTSAFGPLLAWLAGQILSVRFLCRHILRLEIGFPLFVGAMNSETLIFPLGGALSKEVHGITGMRVFLLRVTNSKPESRLSVFQ